MPRNKKRRRVQKRPPASLFKPAGVPARNLERAVLSLDEYEALRLADYEGLKQEDVAERLGVSRPTVSRILAGARRTVATAFVEGRTLVIEGGSVQFGATPGGRGKARGRSGRRRRGRGGQQRR
ncbi:MAG: DUF134 domain-containing protein [Candidatus Brocadiia bacterium]